MVAAALLDGHAGLAVAEEAGVTLAALGTGIRALRGSAECRAGQGAGVCAELIVTVGGALHRCKEGCGSEPLGRRGCRVQGLPLLCLNLPPSAPWCPPSLPLTHDRKIRSSRVPRGLQLPGKHSHRHECCCRECSGFHHRCRDQRHNLVRAPEDRAACGRRPVAQWGW